MKPRILSATTITGTSVQNLKGKNIGKIQDLMIHLETGKILYVVLSFGGFLGMGDTYFAIPMEALVFSDDDNDLIKLNVDKEKLQDAPGFDKDNWPLQPSQEFIDSVYNHYGYTPRTYPSKV